MDGPDEADGSLDPRIEIELENLNKATDDINKLETELDEAHTAFNQLLSETTRRLKKIIDKVGSTCIEKARCYYEALDVAREAQVQCQQQAQLFQRASEIHAAAKETVALAEARFMSHQHEWNFDQAWQDMLNHATLKVMDAENQKAECGREHHRRAMLFHDAEKRLVELEEKHRRSIIKARPYFEVKAQCDQMLTTQRERVVYLQKTIKDAKTNYASSLRILEEISNQIHQQRRDYDFVVTGPREPGVGAELECTEKNLNCESDYSQSSNNRISPVSRSQSKNENKLQDNANEVQNDAEHLCKRSVDGSEATSSQWELELQNSMENLNNSSHEGCESEIFEDENNKSATLGIDIAQESNSNLSEDKKFSVETLSSLQKISRNLHSLKKPILGGSLISNFQGLNLSKQNETVDTLDINKTKILSKGYTSLTSSPVNSHERGCDGKESFVPNKVSELLLKNQKFRCNSDINLSWNLDINTMKEYSNLDGNIINKTLDNKTDISAAKLSYKDLSETGHNSKTETDSMEEEKGMSISRTDEIHPELIKTRPKSRVPARMSYSASSTPNKLVNSSPLPSASSLNNTEEKDLGKYSVLNALRHKKSSIKELPLLSLFSKTNSLADSKGKSCSMIDLDDKRNLKSVLDNSQLDNIKTVSIERLANARHNLFQQTPR